MSNTILTTPFKKSLDQPIFIHFQPLDLIQPLFLTALRKNSPPHTRPHSTTRPPKSTRPPRRRHQFISSVTRPFHFAVRHHFVLTLSLDHLCAAAVESLPCSPYYSITKRGLDHRFVVSTIPIPAHRRITRPQRFTRPTGADHSTKLHVSRFQASIPIC